MVTYTKDVIDALTKAYAANPDIDALAVSFNIPRRSIIAKLSSMGLYTKKPYLTKRGELPVKKEEYIDLLAATLAVDVQLLASLEKVNKNVLKMLYDALSPPK